MLNKQDDTQAHACTGSRTRAPARTHARAHTHTRTDKYYTLIAFPLQLLRERASTLRST